MKAGVIGFPFVFCLVNPCIRMKHGLNIFCFSGAIITNQLDGATKFAVVEYIIQIGRFKYHFKMAGWILCSF